MSDFKNIGYFPGLNALRFFAAILVLMQHGEALKQQNGIANFEWLGLFKNGGNAVSFFFVLSGFLITYLLLKEYKNNASISIKTFYLKRVLRIWPLYFLLVFIGTVGVSLTMPLFDIPYTLPYSLADTWYYFVFFVPGLVTFYYGHHFLEPLWSIGVEEVFYLIWAPLFKWSKNKVLRLLIVVLTAKILINFLAFYFSSNDLLNYIISTFQFEAMALGGLGAYLLFHFGDKFTASTLFLPIIQITVIVLLLVYLLFHQNIDYPAWNAIFNIPVVSRILLHLMFLYLILMVSVIPQSLITFKSRILSYLGEISYGIYMYHMLIISTIIVLWKDQFKENGSIWHLGIFYVISIGLTIVISALSKKYFENRFMHLRKHIET